MNTQEKVITIKENWAWLSNLEKQSVVQMAKRVKNETGEKAKLFGQKKTMDFLLYHHKRLLPTEEETLINIQQQINKKLNHFSTLNRFEKQMLKLDNWKCRIFGCTTCDNRSWICDRCKNTF